MESGEIKLKPIPQGRINVIPRGAFCTDKNGIPLVAYESEVQIYANSLNHAWEIWVVPELKRRKEFNESTPYPIRRIVILLRQDIQKVEVKFNDEYTFNGTIKIKPGYAYEKDQQVPFDAIADYDEADPPRIDGTPVAFCVITLHGKQICISFDFRPNNPEFDIREWDKVGRWLADHFLQIIFAREYGHLALVIPKLSDYDIPFTIGNVEKMKKICYLVSTSARDGEFEKKFSRLLTRKDCNKLALNWYRFDSFHHRTPLLKEALKAFNRGIHAGTILILMSQVEGIITEKLIKHNLGIEGSGEAKGWKKRRDEFYDYVSKTKIGPMISRILVGIDYYLEKSYLYKKFTWIEKSKRVKRNAAMHGKDVTFNTRANAIRMILLFDALYWILLDLSSQEKNNP